MKSQHTGKALERAGGDRARRPSPWCAVQNGVANEPAALRLFEDVYGVCVVCPALHLEPGVVEAHAAPRHRHPRHRPVSRTGSTRARRRSRRRSASATFESVARPDIMRWKYGKLLNNLGNAVDALCGPDPERAGRCSGGRGEEGAACLAAAGIDAVTPEEDAARRGDRFQWGGDAARSRPGASSWQSLARGTGSIEADYLNGEIVLLGRLARRPHAGEPAAATDRGAGGPGGPRPGSMTVDELIQMVAVGE